MEKEKLNIFDKRFVYSVQLPTGATRAIDREELESLTLNPPNPIPELNGGKTWVSNYVGTFWSHFMGAIPFCIYFQILKMAYGEKDYAFPTVPYLAMVIGSSPSTIQRGLKKLIDLNFVIVVHVKDGRTNEFKPNLYLIANTIPFLPEHYYNKLPERLKKEHDDFINRIKRRLITSSEK